MTHQRWRLAIWWTVGTATAALALNTLPLVQLALNVNLPDIVDARGPELLLGLALLALGGTGFAWSTGIFWLSIGVGMLTTFIWVVTQLTFGLVLLYAYPLGAPYFNLYISLRGAHDASYIYLLLLIYSAPTIMLCALVGVIGGAIGCLGRWLTRLVSRRHLSTDLEVR